MPSSSTQSEDLEESLDSTRLPGGNSVQPDQDLEPMEVSVEANEAPASQLPTHFGEENLALWRSGSLPIQIHGQTGFEW